MPALSPPITHIRIDEHGTPWVGETSYKVEFLVLEHLTHGWSPEEINRNHPEQISVAQAYAAIGFYYENRAAMDELMAEGKAEAERILAEIARPISSEMLRAKV